MRFSEDAALFLNETDSYDGVEQYAPVLSDFHETVTSLLAPDWQLFRESIWLHCSTPELRRSLPDQGWKIHLSIETTKATELLQRVVPALIDCRIMFKFAADKKLLYLLNSKHWPRGGSSKFMTIYPPTDEVFKDLVHRLADLTHGFSGPYILSDKRYRDGGIVYYRYGGFRRLTRFTSDGNLEMFIRSPDGTMVRDVRHPYFQLPEWVMDPFQTKEDDPYPDNTLGSGRFTIRDALVFSNAGGVYSGSDNSTGMKVLIKESRPFIYVAGTSSYATDLLKREFEMLSHLSRFGVSPKPVSHFVEWEHHYLVEEFLEGDTIASHWSALNILLRPHASHEDKAEYRQTYFKVAIAACMLLDTLHKQGVVFGDLSPNNVMIDPDDDSLRVIDMESASFFGEENTPTIYTPGFARIFRGHPRNPNDDYFALGSILSFMLFPLNRLFILDGSTITRIVPELARDSGFPEELSELVIKLMHSEQSSSFNLLDIASELQHLANRDSDHSTETVQSAVIETSTQVETDKIKEQHSTAVNAILAFTLSRIDYSRSDRFFPASSGALKRNPYCLGTGIAGLVEALVSANQDIPPEMLEKLRSAIRTEVRLPHGLFSGLAGISHALSRCGLLEEALRAARLFRNHEDIFSNPFYENGIAGCGIISLNLYLKSRDEALLSFVTRAAQFLVDTALCDVTGYRWEGDKQDYGLGNGSSGIALFLLYAYLATHNAKYLSVGRNALAFDLSAGRLLDDDSMAWEHMDNGSGILYPYWCHGSAGVGEVTLRYLAVTGNPYYKTSLDRICRYTERKYAVLPGLLDGLSGLGNFLLNCGLLLADENYHRRAETVASGLRLHLLRRDEGLTVCDFRGKINCDYATGSAGAAVFLSRMVTPEMFSLFPDQLITRPDRTNSEL